MKKHFLLLMSIFTLSCCNKDDDSNASLPPATQTGSGTFACYVNGEAFIDTSGGWFNCFYQYVDGEYYFGIQGDGKIGMLTSIGLSTNMLEIQENETYILTLPTEENAASGAGGITQNISTGTFVWTNQEDTGELTITKLDFTNHIVSGTFWFNITNPYTGERIEIREGRFDTLFTE